MFEHQCRKGVTTCGDCKKEKEIVHPKVPKIVPSLESHFPVATRGS